MVMPTKEAVKEKWKWAKGYKSLYKISTHGNVKSYKRDKPQLLRTKTTTLRNPYPRVNLHKNGKVIQHLVHRLMLETFKGPCPPGMEARHLNDVKTCNVLDNLCWGTHKENGEDCSNNGRSNPLIGENHPKCKISDSTVQYIRKYCKKHGYGSMVRMAKKFHLSVYYVRRLCKREYRKELPNASE